jgi:hypothetical protein
MTSPGAELRKERESRNLSIEEMAASTKIVGRYLRALEDDRLGDMPGGFFIRGIIRSYATCLGLDPKKVLETYEEAGLLGEPGRKWTSGPAKTSPFTGRNKVLTGTLVVLGLVLVMVVLVFVLRSKRPHLQQPEPAAKDAAAQRLPLTPPPVEHPAAQPASEKEWKGVTIEITFHELTWVQVVADGELKIDGQFTAGQTATAHADKDLVINTGNAGGMTFLLNGRPGKSLGGRGKVRSDVRITPENMQEFLEPGGAAEPSR